VNRCAGDGAAIEALKPALGLRGGPIFSGRVTLKYASSLPFPHGPGVSMEAEVNARMKVASLR